MADADFTLQSTEETRAGAFACIEALRAIEKIANSEDFDLTNEEWWRDEDNAVAAMLHAAGMPSGFLAGFIAVFAEYAKWSICTGQPDLSQWKPEAAMTTDEKVASRKEFDAGVEKGKLLSPEDIIRANEVRELKYKKAFERAQGWLTLDPDNAEDYKKRAAFRITNMAKICSENSAKMAGYSLADESCKNLRQAIGKVEETILRASVCYSPSNHEQHRRELVRQAFEQEFFPHLNEVERDTYLQRLMIELLSAVTKEAEAVHN